MPGPRWYQALAYLMVGSLAIFVPMVIVGLIVHSRNRYNGAQLFVAAFGNLLFGCCCLIALALTAGVAGTDGRI